MVTLRAKYRQCHPKAYRGKGHAKGMSLVGGFSKKMIKCDKGGGRGSNGIVVSLNPKVDVCRLIP